MGCTQRELHSPVRFMVCTSPLYALSVIQNLNRFRKSFYGENFRTAIGNEDSVLELANITAVFAC